MVIVPLSKKSKRMAGNSLGGTGHYAGKANYDNEIEHLASN